MAFMFLLIHLIPGGEARAVLGPIAQALPKTLILVGLATLFAVVVAIPLGVYQVVRRNKPEDYIITGVSFVLYAMPAFLLGTLLILWFGIYIKIFPPRPPRARL